MYSCIVIHLDRCEIIIGLFGHLLKTIADQQNNICVIKRHVIKRSHRHMDCSRFYGSRTRPDSDQQCFRPSCVVLLNI